MHHTKTFQAITASVCVALATFHSVAGIAFEQKNFSRLPSNLSGEWFIKSLYKTPNISGIDMKQAKSLLGTYIKYTDNSLEACGQRAKINKVSEKLVTAAEFIAGRKVTRFSDVEIYAPSIREITINERNSGNCFGTYELPGEDIYFKSEKEILVDFEGMYLRAVRR